MGTAIDYCVYSGLAERSLGGEVVEEGGIV